MSMQSEKKILYPLHSALRETQQWIVATLANLSVRRLLQQTSPAPRTQGATLANR
jgi:hypothetical protein